MEENKKKTKLIQIQELTKKEKLTQQELKLALLKRDIIISEIQLTKTMKDLEKLKKKYKYEH